MPDLLRHLRGLAGQEAGPYIEAAARGYSHQVWVEPFRARLSGRWPWVIVLALGFAGGALAGWRADVALPISVLAVAGMAAQAGGWLHFGRLFTWRVGRNIVAIIPSADALHHRVVLIARWDTPRVSQRLSWLTAGREWLLLRIGGAAVAGTPFVLALERFGAAVPGWALPLCVAVAGGASLLLSLRELGGRSAGEGPDNAGAVAVALHLGELLARGSIRHTEIWTVFTGCPDGGVHDLLDRYGTLLADAHLFILDSAGGGPVRYQPEQGALGRVAGVVASLHPGVGAEGGHPAPGTEAHAALRRGYGALAISGGSSVEEWLTMSGFLAGLVEQIDRQEA